MTQPITAKDKAEFSKQLSRWQLLLGMGDWRVAHSAKPVTPAGAVRFAFPVPVKQIDVPPAVRSAAGDYETLSVLLLNELQKQQQLQQKSLQELS